MNADGSSPLQVTYINQAEYTSWSPNGRWIVFDSTESGHDEIYKIHPDGTGLRQLTTYPLVGSSADWSPGGTSIAFSGTDSGGLAAIWVMTKAGGRAYSIARVKGYPSFDPAWSPDGRWIAFDSGGPTTRRVWVVGKDGRAKRLLTKKGNNPGWQPLP